MAINTTSVKRHHHHSSSTSSGCAPIPPQKKLATNVFSSLNHNQLKKALQTGGASDFDVKTGKTSFCMKMWTAHWRNTVFRQKILQVDFYPIPTCDLEELIEAKKAFDIQGAELFSGNVRLDLSLDAVIGVGAFKMAQVAKLMLLPLRCSGLGSQPNHDVVLKRPYIDNHPMEPGPPFTCYTLKDESNILYREANVLYWAKSLLKMTYEFIDHAIDNSKVAPPPFEIPCVHFVDAGLLLAYSDVLVATTERTSQSAKPIGTVSTVYLAEERIPTLNGDFVKYIHNSDAAPCGFLDTTEDKIANFLAFMQHVQYMKTGGQVYISDYQGMFKSAYWICSTNLHFLWQAVV